MDGFPPWLGKLLVLLGIPVIAFAWFTWSQFHIPTPPKPPDDECFAWGLNTYLMGMIGYRVEHGEFPEDTPPGVMPKGFAKYARPMGEGCWGENRYFPSFPDETPIGGRWDIARDTLGIRAGIGVHFDGMGPARGEAYMQQLDRQMDDGDLTTGYFRKLTEHDYYFLVGEYMPEFMEQIGADYR